jgi:hypothetical protein
VETATSDNERDLRGRLEQARERLTVLVRDLRALDDELEQLADDRKRHALVHETCRTLAALAELGGAPLFWGEEVADGASRVRLALGRVDAFEKRIGLLEERRQALLDEVALREQGYELAEYDVLELEREQEQRRLEWVVERELAPLPARQAVMPWSGRGEDEQRFRRSLATALFASAVLAVVVPQIPLPVLERHTVIEVPERLARLLQQPRPLPPPARPVDAREKPQPTPEEKPRVAKEPVPAPSPQPGQGAGPTSGPTQGAGSGPKGILAFREQLSGLARSAPGAKLGLEARISSAADAASGRPERSLVTSMAAGSNAGVNLASMSRGGGGGGRQLAGVAVARATSTIGGGGGGGGAPGGGAGTGSGGGPLLGRTDEEIQIVFDRHKAELYRLYNRELRSDPTLEGQIVLRMRIEPDGSVSLCALQTTDMDAPQLAAQVVERVRGFDFGAKDGIAAVTILYPIEFLPAT